MAKDKFPKQLAPKEGQISRVLKGNAYFQYEEVIYQDESDPLSPLTRELDVFKRWQDDPLSVTGLKSFIELAAKHLEELGFKPREGLNGLKIYRELLQNGYEPHSLEAIYALAILKYIKMEADPVWCKGIFKFSDEMRLSLAWEIGRLSLQALYSEKTQKNKTNAQKSRSRVREIVIARYSSDRRSREEQWQDLKCYLENLHDSDIEIEDGEITCYTATGKPTPYTYKTFYNTLSSIRQRE